MTGQFISHDNIYTVNADDSWMISPTIMLEKDSFAYLTHLKEFNWLFNTIAKVDPLALSPLKNIQTLRIHCSAYNSLGTLNQTLINLALHCSEYEDRNALMDLVPDGVLSASKLKTMSHFSILSTLTLSLNLMSISNGAFSWVSSLRKLDLNGNSLIYLSQYAFDGLDHLEELDLSFNSFTTLPSGALQAFQSSSRLRVLNFDSNQINTLNNMSYSKPFGSSEHLEELVLSNNRITGNLSESIFDTLPSLRLLDLSGNPLSDTGSWMPLPTLEELYLNEIDNGDTGRIIRWKSLMPTLKVLNLKNVQPHGLTDGQSLCSLAPNLQTITLDGSGFYSFSFLKQCHNLRMLDLSNNEIQSDLDFYNTNNYNDYIIVYFYDYGDDDEGWMELSLLKLEVLILKNNKISYLKENTFEVCTSLKELDLSYNLLSNVPSEVFKPLPYLERLDLSSNKIVNLKPVYYLSYITFLSAASNQIVEVSKRFLQSTKSTMQELDVSGNPLECSCKASSFQDWILSDTRVLLKFSPGFYDCATPDTYIGIAITEVHLNCRSHLYIYLSISVSIVITICVLIFVAIRYRWHISYKFFLIFKRSKKESYIDEETLVESSSGDGVLGNNRQYDAYVAYSRGDEDWILNEFLHKLEDTEEPLRLFIGDRDFPLGECILDCIAEGIQRSRKTVLVLSPRFAEDEWRYFEMQMAQQRLFQEGRDVLVLVLLEDIPEEKLTMLMRHMLCHRDYLKWPNDKLGQDLFWRRLKEELRTPNRVDRINHM
ncbi:toll-like receptor 6 [Amphiura filiformis]|uniref:toll-like receptor 6 n=1 Tax=Amphiura filiformis TaxID=82378 RepID=UPI003B20F19C